MHSFTYWPPADEPSCEFCTGPGVLQEEGGDVLVVSMRTGETCRAETFEGIARLGVVRTEAMPAHAPPGRVQVLKPGAVRWTSYALASIFPKVDG